MGSASSVNDRIDAMVDDMLAAGMSRKDICARIRFKANDELVDDYPSSEFKNLIRAHVLIQMFSRGEEPPSRKKVIEPPNSIDDVVDLIARSKNVLVLTGAGVSTSCGLPDFRSKDGVYAIVGKDSRIKEPTDLFNIEFFRTNVQPFYDFAKELWPGNVKPSPCHRFIRALERNKKLLRNYTQNIDTLESVCGIKHIIQCHGSFDTATCTSCKFKCDGKEISSSVLKGKLPYCPKCSEKEKLDDDREDDTDPSFTKGVMKPDITFFGEALPDLFHKNIKVDIPKCDLLIVIGTSLQVAPVSNIIKMVDKDVPQILINREIVAEPHEFDIELLGNCDDVVRVLAKRLEWTIDDDEEEEEDKDEPEFRHNKKRPSQFLFPGSEDFSAAEDDDDDGDVVVGGDDDGK